jgi:hypothetical protein
MLRRYDGEGYQKTKALMLAALKALLTKLN